MALELVGLEIDGRDQVLAGGGIAADGPIGGGAAARRVAANSTGSIIWPMKPSAST